jgi:hypothetical protein
MAKIKDPYVGQSIYLKDNGERYYGVIVEILNDDEFMATFGDDTPLLGKFKEHRTDDNKK